MHLLLKPLHSSETLIGKKICGTRQRPDYQTIKFPVFGLYVRVGGPNATPDSNPNN